MSSEQVENLLRKTLNPDQYVTVQQIKSLVRWAKLLKDDQLEEPKEKENIDTDELTREWIIMMMMRTLIKKIMQRQYKNR